MEKTKITRQQMISQLIRSEHGKLEAYESMGLLAAKEDPEFLAHMIAWNQTKGVVRDSKVALPVIQLSVGPGVPEEFVENALGHLALQSPRELLKGVRYSRACRPAGYTKKLRSVVEQYLRAKEADEKRFPRAVMQHRKALKELYALLHIAPSPLADGILFQGKKPGVLGRIARLKDMSARDAASTIIKDRIPFLVAAPMIGQFKDNPDFILSLIEQMTPQELVTNTKMLQKLGMQGSPALRGAFDAKLTKVAQEGKNVLKTQQAAKATGNKKLAKVAEKQLDRSQKVEGDWLILADKSGSMHIGIEIGRQIAAILSRMVSGKVVLVFFNTAPRAFDVSGKTLEEIEAITNRETAAGGTSIGCGLDWALQNKMEFDGIAIVSDGGENNHPIFAEVLPRYQKMFDKTIPVYYYKVGSTAYTDSFMKHMGMWNFPVEAFDLTSRMDYYSLPNLVQTMRTNRYSLADEILATPLVTVKEVLKL